ncbi:hypothetical protein [Polaromonas sp.]|uniref:hypothetical protein n=1 Tax=Polaromonas sp. TaxID=1869339 RepID=UPI00326647E5
MKKLYVTRVLSASLLLFGSIAIACSPPPPTFDPTGRTVHPPEPTFRYEFIGVVVGEAKGFVPARGNAPATEIAALRIRVVRSSGPDLSIDSEHTLYRAGIGADCGFQAGSLNVKDFPVGSEVVVKSNDLVSGRVIDKIEDPRPALDKAIRDGSIRKATAEDVRAFRDAYVEKKYTRKSLPVPVTEDALSVTRVDISRAYVVLNKFTYPSGLLNEYRAVFFVPIGVPEPSGEIGHSAFYDFETLTVVCTLARTGGISC